jgi:hypothetical protein
VSEQLAAAAEELKVALKAAADREVHLQGKLQEVQCSGDLRLQRHTERTAKVGS